MAGNVDGKPFEWLADADPRLGPVLEAIVDAKYFWIPMHNIKQIRLDPPTDLRDVVWLPANFVWSNGGSAVGLIPTRYPGSESSEDGAVRLARKTEWTNLGPGYDVPLGQRLFAAGETEYPMLEVRRVTFGADIPDEPAPVAST
jgi:type VI secretion system protein ImpE